MIQKCGQIKKQVLDNDLPPPLQVGLQRRHHRLGRGGPGPRQLDPGDAQEQPELAAAAQLRHPGGHQGQARTSNHLRASSEQLGVIVIDLILCPFV